MEHGNRYSYDESSYRCMNCRVTVECSIHGKWSVLANIHSRKGGSGCPMCFQSRGEESIRECLDELWLDYVQEASFEGLGRKKFDFYVPELNLLIEYDGEQHFRPIEFFGGEPALANTVARDEEKSRWAWENKFVLMRIPYWMLDRIPYLIREQVALLREFPHAPAR